MGAPQIIWIVLAAVVLVTSYACDGLTNVISFKQRVFDVIAMTALVWWGGFFVPRKSSGSCWPLWSWLRPMRAMASPT